MLQEVPSWTMGDEEEPDVSTTAEEYFSNSSGQSIVEEVLNDVLDRVAQICEGNETLLVSNIKLLYIYFDSNDK